MASVHDVAAYILRERGEMDTWKLQKLSYYSQAWHTVWDGEPLFMARIEAWANGPVVPELYREHKGRFKVDRWKKGKISNLTRSQKESIDVVLKHYGRFTGFTLRERTHQEPPWRDARENLPPGAPGNTEITIGAITSYYGSL